MRAGSPGKQHFNVANCQQGAISTRAAGLQAVRQDTAGRVAAAAGPQAVRWDPAGRETAEESTRALPIAGVAMTIASSAEKLAAAAQPFNEAQQGFCLMKWTIISLSILLPLLMAILILMKQMQRGSPGRGQCAPTRCMKVVILGLSRGIAYWIVGMIWYRRHRPWIR